MMRRLLRVSGLAVGLLALTLAGCGGDDDGSGGNGNGGEASTQEFVKKADAICAEANKKEAALGPEGLGWIFTEQFDDPGFLTRFHAVDQAALRQLNSLELPEEKRQAAEEMISSLTRISDAMEQQIRDLRAKRRDTAAAHVQELETAFSDLAVAAGSVGVSECQGVGN
jgi:hypothetical protein